jgi:hypothetical protein
MEFAKYSFGDALRDVGPDERRRSPMSYSDEADEVVEIQMNGIELALLFEASDMSYSDEADEVVEIQMNGIELALLFEASDILNSWPYRLNAPRETFTQDERIAIREIAAYLYEEWKHYLIAAGAFMPTVTPVAPRAYVNKRATIEAVVCLAEKEIRMCSSVMRFCHDELSTDPEDWMSFCDISRSGLMDFKPSLTDLLDVVSKLEGALRGAPRQRRPVANRPHRLDHWPPSGAIAIVLNGVEVALLEGSLSLLNVWCFLKPTAQPMLVQAEREMSGLIAKNLSGEQQSQLRSAGALAPHAPRRMQS